METETKSQVDKFKERVIKSKGKSYNSNEVVTITKKFNFVDLTAAITHSKAAKLEKQEKVSEKKFKITKSKLANYVEPTIFDNTHIEAAQNSIKKYIDECHPDVRTFINKNEIRSVKAGAGEMIIITRNSLRMVITTIGKYQRSVTIHAGKQELFKGKTSVKITKEVLTIQQKN